MSSETPISLIDKLFVFTTDIDGHEMILTGTTPHGVSPFVTGEKGEMYKHMSAASQEVADGMGKVVKLVVYERKEVEVTFEQKLVKLPGEAS